MYKKFQLPSIYLHGIEKKLSPQWQFFLHNNPCDRDYRQKDSLACGHRATSIVIDPDTRSQRNQQSVKYFWQNIRKTYEKLYRSSCTQHAYLEVDSGVYPGTITKSNGQTVYELLSSRVLFANNWGMRMRSLQLSRNTQSRRCSLQRRTRRVVLFRKGENPLIWTPRYEADSIAAWYQKNISVRVFLLPYFVVHTVMEYKMTNLNMMKAKNAPKNESDVFRFIDKMNCKKHER